ncbi:MAG: GerMN domain-containing protein [Pseudanabaenaceae cyanobacterium]
MGSFKPMWLLVGLAAVAVGAAVGILFSNPAPQPVEVPTPPVESREINVTLYWLNSQGDRLVAVPKVVKEKSIAQALKLALQSLIKEPPSDGKSTSAIPRDTEILDLQINGKEIRVNLSQAFQQGGGTASIRGRILQLLYTLTSLEPDAQVYLAIEGKPVEYLGGEGLEVRQPMTRKDYPDAL